MRVRSIVLCAALVAAFGCDETEPPPPDAQVDAGPLDAGLVFIVDPPAPPALPSIAWLADGVAPALPPVMTCPTGWRAVDDASGVELCEPWPVAGPLDCPAGEAHFPGETGCSVIGDACPASGAWPASLPSGPVVYVREGSSGDGSMASPFGTLTEAVAAAADGAVVAIAEGRYDEALVLDRGLTLVGVCASRVVLAPTSPGAGVEAVVQMSADGAGIRNLRIEGADLIGVRVSGAAVVASIDGVEISDVRARGVHVNANARADMRDLHVHDVRADPSSGQGWGLSIVEMGQCTLDRAVIRDVIGVGALVDDATVSITQTAIRRVATQGAAGEFGRGINGEGDATIALDRVVIEDVFDYGIVAVTPSTSITGSDVVVDGTRALAPTPSGSGVSAQTASTVALTRVLLRNTQSFGLTAVMGGRVTLADAVVLDSRPNETNGIDGGGLGVGTGATLTGERVWIARAVSGGVVAANRDTRLTLEDLTVLDVDPTEMGVFGRGVWVEAQTQLTLRRARIERATEVGLFLGGATADLEDVSIRATRPRPTGELGIGLQIEDRAFMTGRRVLVAESRMAGVAVLEPGTELELEDLVVRDTGSQRSDGDFGGGLQIDTGGSARVTRALLERSSNVAVVCRGAGTSLTLTDATIAGTMPRESDSVNGVGLGVVLGGSATLERVSLRENQLAGIYVHDADSTLTANDLEVVDTRESAGFEDVFGGGTGYGVLAGDGAVMDGARWSLERNRSIGLAARGAGTMVRSEHVAIVDTQPYVREQALGRGVSVVVGAALELRHTSIRGNLEVGVFAWGENTSVILEDAEVLDTQPAACEASDCRGQSGGIGIGSYEGAAVSATRFAVRDSALCGIQIARDGGLDLSTGEVARSPVGACLQVSGYDIARLTLDVLWLELQTVVETTDFAVPELPELPDVD